MAHIRLSSILPAAPRRSAALLLLIAALLLTVVAPRPAQALGSTCEVVSVPTVETTHDDYHNPSTMQCESKAAERSAAYYAAMHVLDPIVPAMLTGGHPPAMVHVLVRQDDHAVASLQAPPLPPPPKLSSV